MTTAFGHEEHISQRDLRSRSREIMDGVEAGESFAVTRDGRVIGHLVPEQGPRRFVSRERFEEMFTGPGPDLDLFRSDQKEHMADEIEDPYDRA